eukprot:CAMPEP_0172708646 /NCGR_PEP_ID=MMETSP1074-20121228/51709_1 /TAXON_ID=2916 /ORGANISM="Ceratium fusus, Strain PA161109" /LENGTH=275 /DNA_ID=CAMNT_0013531667 /DNA_START=61 /DNA_END=888 /DNA_ORIENTATION=+
MALSVAETTPGVIQRCPGGHELQKWAGRGGSCSCCRRHVKFGEHVMDCRRCDWYLCQTCCPPNAQQQPRSKLWAAVKCLPYYVLDGVQHGDLSHLPVRLGPMCVSCAAANVASDNACTEIVFQPALQDDTSTNSAPYRDHELENLLHQLFVLHDLRKNDLLEERELVLLNRKIAIAHYGEDINKEELTMKYQELFRTRLAESDEQRAVPYARFRCYMLDVLNKLDSDRDSQRNIVEQFIAEASLGRALFHDPGLRSDSDISFLSTITKPADEKWR